MPEFTPCTTEKSLCACMVFCRASAFYLHDLGTNRSKVRDSFLWYRFPYRFPATQPQKRYEGTTMTIINLRDFYYCYLQDEYMEVSDEPMWGNKIVNDVLKNHWGFALRPLLGEKL